MPGKTIIVCVIPVFLSFAVSFAWANDECGVSGVLAKRSNMLKVAPSSRAEQIASYYRERALLERRCKDSRFYLNEQATPEQSSLFAEWAGSSSHFYALTRISSYVFNAKGQPPVEFAKLQASAASLFDSQRRFTEALTSSQRAALRSQLHGIEKLRRDSEKRLNRLAPGTLVPASPSYLKAVRRLKRDLQDWNFEQQEIANRIGIQ